MNFGNPNNGSRKSFYKQSADAAGHCTEQGCPLLLAMELCLIFAGVTSGFSGLFIAFLLFCQHPVIYKPDTSKCFCKQFLLYFIGIDPKPVYYVHIFSPPVSRCTGGSLLPDLQILFFDQTAAGAFIGIDKFTEFRLRMGTEHDMDMVLIVIPLFQGDMIFGRDIFKDFSCAIRDRIIQDLFPVLYDQDQMIIE